MPSTVTPLGALLKQRREARGLSRLRLEQLSGIKAGTIETWEQGRVDKPPIHDVLRIARVLSISLHELERVVLDDPLPGDARDERRAAPVRPDSAPGSLLLERVVARMQWDDHEAAEALGVPVERVGELRAGHASLSIMESVTLLVVLASGCDDSGDAVVDLLVQLRTA